MSDNPFDAETVDADFFAVSDDAPPASFSDAGGDDPFFVENTDDIPPPTSQEDNPFAGEGQNSAPLNVSGGDSDMFSDSAPYETTEQTIVEEFSSADIMASGENNALTRWRGEHQQKLQERARKSAEAKEASRAKGKQAIDQFYQKRKAQTEKDSQKNSELISSRDANLGGGGSSWAKVASFVDFKKPSGEKDVTRMRTLLMSLKH